MEREDTERFIDYLHETEANTKKGGAPVATNKEQRPSEARERRGRETVSAPERRRDE